MPIETVIIGGDLASATSLSDYAAAKAGDVPSAVRVAQTVVTPELVERVRRAIGGSKPIIVPVASVEATGRNKLPLAAAEVLARHLGLEVATDIVQANAPKRTAMSGLDRLFARPVFDGPVVSGRDYLLLDDTLTQGGTFAALAHHIESGGGRVDRQAIQCENRPVPANARQAPVETWRHRIRLPRWNRTRLRRPHRVRSAISHELQAC